MTKGLVRLLALHLRDARLHHLLNERGGQRLVRGKLDGPLGRGVALEIALEFLDHRCRGEQTAVIRKRREPQQNTVVLDCRNPVADGFISLRRGRGPDCSTNLVERGAGGLRNTSKVLVHGFRSGPTSRSAFAFFCFPHVADATRISISNPCSVAASLLDQSSESKPLRRQGVDTRMFKPDALGNETGRSGNGCVIEVQIAEGQAVEEAASEI